MSKDEMALRSRALDKEIQKDYQGESQVAKLLLLGTGGHIASFIY